MMPYEGRFFLGYFQEIAALLNTIKPFTVPSARLNLGKSRDGFASLGLTPPPINPWVGPGSQVPVPSPDGFSANKGSLASKSLPTG